ncbi:TPA: hypothetical protein ACGDOV_003960, partial [Acinetobacter baumannii]
RFSMRRRQQFLNHLCDEQQMDNQQLLMFKFLNHLCDEQRRPMPLPSGLVFLNHLCDEQLELSKNKTLKNNNIKF